jgi:O-antigen/teichoic acid export membrane protein
MTDSKLLKGTFILTAATFISKFLGMIYVFPFYALIGQKGAALYTYAYLPYAVLLSIATMGVPLAVSKFVSKYNALGDYHTGRRMFRSGLFFTLATGIIAFLLLFMLAPAISPLIIGDSKYGNGVNDVTYVIRMVSFALVIVPMMSLIRGFFQGHQQMEPTAVSQVIEQIVRIIFILGGTYIVLRVLNGEMQTAVGLSTFAAFIGAVAGMLVLVWFWIRQKHELNQLRNNSNYKSELTMKGMYKELLMYAGPFVFVGLAIPLYQMVDQFTFNRAMISIGKDRLSEMAFSTLNFSSHKLVMIPVSLATAFALTLIPTVTKSFTEKNYQLLHQQISQSFQVVVFLTLPAVVGLSVLSYPAFAFFFDVNDAETIGGFVLKWYAPVALLFAFFTITSAILQGINQQRFAVVSLFIGLLLKMTLNVPLIQMFETLGSIIATAIGFIASIAVNFWVIKKYANFRYRIFMKRSLLITIFVAIMVIVVMLTEWVMSNVASYNEGRLQAMFVLLISIAVGAGTYLWLSAKSNLIKAILGKRKIQQKKSAM